MRGNMHVQLRGKFRPECPLHVLPRLSVLLLLGDSHRGYLAPRGRLLLQGLGDLELEVFHNRVSWVVHVKLRGAAAIAAASTGSTTVPHPRDRY